MVSLTPVLHRRCEQVVPPLDELLLLLVDELLVEVLLDEELELEVPPEQVDEPQ